MQATPQAVGGGGKVYSSKTRLGNWAEEIAIQEAKLKSFQKRSASGSLSLRKQEIKLTLCNEIVPHSFSADGMLRFGDTVVLQHDVSGSILACDPFEDQVQGQEKFAVTASMQPPSVPRARSTFRILRPPPSLRAMEDEGDDPILRVGQAFCLGCNESLLVQPSSNILSPMLFLASTKKNERTVTRNTNRQMIYMSPKNDADSVWTVAKPSKGKANSSERFLANGNPVIISEAYQFTHRQTNMFLTCDEHIKSMSEYGVELECFADRTALCGKLAIMVSEFKGISTPQTLSKPDSPVYAWHFVASSDESAAVDTRVLPPPATLDVLLQEMLLDVKSRGVDGFWNLRAYFLSLGNFDKIDREDLKEAMKTWGFTLESRYFDPVIDLIDTNRSSLIDWREFVRLVRGSMPSARAQIVAEVFAALDGSNPENPPGHVSVDDLAYYFNGTDHPLVALGGVSEKDALAHMLQSISTRGRTPQLISLALFSDYYADLSACVDDNAYFEQVVRSSWPVV